MFLCRSGVKLETKMSDSNNEYKLENIPICTRTDSMDPP